MVELLELLKVSITLAALSIAVPAVIITGTDVPDIEPLLDPPQVVDKSDKE